MVNSDEFSERLQNIMDRHALNASSFAEKIGVGRSTMSHILSGRNKPSLDFVLAVLKTFKDADLYWLLNGKGSYPRMPEVDDTDGPIKKIAAPLPSTATLQETVAPASVPTQDKNNLNNLKKSTKDMTTKGKNISRVILFYDDGTFENFIP